MVITINPFTSNSVTNLNWSHANDKIEKHNTENKPPITYWGIYLDGIKVSYTSSKELAEKTKVWMEKWLNKRN
jgi:hypothetical protein